MYTNEFINDTYFEFVFTGDGSTGLYNKDVQDVYHSVFGAKEEAEQKFVEPLEFVKNYSHFNKIKVLDICFGIGYNTKALLKKIISTNYNGKVEIDIIEQDKNLVTISPFIKDGYFKKFPQIAYVMTSFLIKDIHDNQRCLENILSNKHNKKFIEPFFSDLIKKYSNFGYTYDPLKKNNRFLHNIHYQCISTRNKKPPKGFRLRNFTFNAYYNDARKVVKGLNGKYNIIFLDAFTPAKLPTLWTFEFFKELYRVSDKNCMLVTYSNSIAVRNAMIKAGFVVGKLFDKNKRHCGTIASPNSRLIKNKLDDYDIGLMNTRAGIYFKDENLDAEPCEILSVYNKEKSESKLESSSSYIKRHKTENINASI